MKLQDYFAQMPLIAILRGIAAEQIDGVGALLLNSGFCIIEVPLNSPDPFASIARLAKRHTHEILVGAGTVMTLADIDKVKNAGGQLIVMPHCDAELIRAAKQQDLFCIPGVATPSEAFAALKAGADALKLFPAENLPPKVVKAWRAVLPAEVALLPVGGITPDSLSAYWKAGASGFGLGSALYKPDASLADIEANARQFTVAMAKLIEC